MFRTRLLVGCLLPAWMLVSIASTAVAQPPEQRPGAPLTPTPSDDALLERLQPPRFQPSMVADEPDAPRVAWNDRWTRFGIGNYLVTAGAVGLSFGSLAFPPDTERWTNPPSFDRKIRDKVRISDHDDRFRARDASDVFLVLSANQLLVDTVIVTWWGHGSSEVAWQMALMNAEAIAINAAINGTISGLSSRQRPYGPELCVGEANEQLDDCRSNNRYRSFYSGHSSTAFTAAALTCMHHAHLPLYGGGAPDALPCVLGFMGATATGALRVLSDQHWASDVMVGAAAGTATGLLVPWLLHYREGELPEPAAAGEVTWKILPAANGASLIGEF